MMSGTRLTPVSEVSMLDRDEKSIYICHAAPRKNNTHAIPRRGQQDRFQSAANQQLLHRRAEPL